MTVISASASLSSISASASFPNQTVTGGISPSGILYRRPILTGQTTSYATYDDGWNLANNVYDYTRPANPATVAELDHDAVSPFTTLKENNAFGNTNRWTDDAGGQTYANDYLIDHLTGLGWIRTVKTSVNWAAAVSNAQSATDASLSSWRLPSRTEVLSILSTEAPTNNRFLSWTQWGSQTGTYDLWTSSTLTANSTIAWSVLYSMTVNAAGKTSTKDYLICRNHY